MGQKETKFEQPDVQRCSYVVAHFGGWLASKKGAGSVLRETMQIEMELAAYHSTYVRSIQKFEI